MYIQTKTLYRCVNHKVRYYKLYLTPTLFGEYLFVREYGSVKYKKPATTTIRAIASIKEEEKEKFLAQFMKKKRASINVSVEVLDEKDQLLMSGEFNWFVQEIDI